MPFLEETERLASINMLIESVKKTLDSYFLRVSDFLNRGSLYSSIHYLIHSFVGDVVVDASIILNCHDIILPLLTHSFTIPALVAGRPLHFPQLSCDSTKLE